MILEFVYSIYIVNGKEPIHLVLGAFRPLIVRAPWPVREKSLWLLGIEPPGSMDGAGP